MNTNLSEKLPFHEFELYMEKLQKTVLTIWELSDFINDDKICDLEWSVEVAVDLLTKFMDDKERWIAHWVYELDFGEGYYDGCVTVDYGATIVPLRTVRELYDFVCQRSKGE